MVNAKRGPQTRVPGHLAAAVSAALGDGRARHPRRRSAASKRSSSRRPGAPRACRTSPSRSARSTPRRSRCAACSRSTTSRSSSRACRSRTREPGGTTIVFRGVAPLRHCSSAPSRRPRLYLDEQPITQSGRNPDPRLIDIERIEALRGPQGTLYGASSQSGTLRVITNKPDPSGFDAWVEGAGRRASTDGGTGYDVSAMVNMPLVAGPPRAAARRIHVRGRRLTSTTSCREPADSGHGARARRSTTRARSTRTSTRGRRPAARARRCAGT